MLIIASEAVDELIARAALRRPGRESHHPRPGRRQLRLGQILRAGGARLQASEVRVPCDTLDVYGPTIKQEIYDKAGDSAAAWGLSGFYASVMQDRRTVTI